MHLIPESLLVPDRQVWVVTLMKVITQMIHDGCWGCIPAKAVLRWEVLVKRLLGGWSGQTPAHRTDVPQLLGTCLLCFQAQQPEFLP